MTRPVSGSVVIAAAAAAIVSFLFTRQVTSDHSPPPPASDICLHAAVKTYPSWPVTDPPVLETIQGCAGLPADQRNTLRDELAAFVSAANTRIEGG